MKLTCQTDALLAACQLVGAAVAARSTMPILANIKAIAQDDALVIMGTDQDVGIRYELRGVDVKRAGACIIPPHRLISILRECAEETVSIDASQNSIHVKAGSGKYELPNGDPDSFPDLPTFETGQNYHEVTAGLLRTLIKRVAFAADKKEGTRWAVTGVLWEAEKDRVRLVATDTKRLALVEGAAVVHGGTDPKGPSHLIPIKTVQLLERHLTDDSEPIQIALRPNGAMFQTGRWLIHTKLVEGRFPPYKDIIPKKSVVKLPLDTATFASRVRQAAIMSDEESKRVDFQFAGPKLTLLARGADTGSSEVTMPLENYDGPDIEIAFDPQYVLEFLRAVDGEPNVLLEMTDGTKPAVFRVGEHYSYLVMPMGG
ncbi:MAG: DNA polymerase III subunit beta [Gemmataceae bacterium]